MQVLIVKDESTKISKEATADEVAMYRAQGFAVVVEGEASQDLVANTDPDEPAPTRPGMTVPTKPPRPVAKAKKPAAKKAK